MSDFERQSELLTAISQMGSHGRAEGEEENRFPLTYYPVAEHLRAFDPDVVLIVGPRGSGKTELFRAVIQLGLLPDIAKNVAAGRLPPLGQKQTQWVAAYPQGTGFPDPMVLKRFIQERGAKDEDLVDLWAAYLLRTLKENIRDASGLVAMFEPQAGDLNAVIDGFSRCRTQALLALDSLDERLVSEDRHMFIAYDELDTLAQSDWNAVMSAVRGLVGFWAARTRRWKRIRAKIFLRTDLFERSGSVGGADFAKLAANRAELTWSDRHLYAMLLKRLANTNGELLDYCSNKVPFQLDQRLGQIPKILKAADAKPFVERLVGRYMGANERKGLAFTWLLDHIRDGRGQALPRPLVRLVEAAASVQAEAATHARWPKLLEPKSLRRAVDKVSSEHVTQSLDEWPWLDGLMERLKSEREVPWDRRRIEKLLDEKWNDTWGKEEGVRPPAVSARDLVDYLVEVGVFRSRPDHRVDVTDLFLNGLGLKRRGGVRRR